MKSDMDRREALDLDDYAGDVRGSKVGLRGYDAKAVSEATAVDTGSESLVQAHFQEETDINTIVRRFGVMGAMPTGPNGPGVYGDFTGLTDFYEARETMRRAERDFMALPASVRARFDNDPGRLIELAATSSEDEFMAVFQPPVEAPGAPPVSPSGDSGV